MLPNRSLEEIAPLLERIADASPRLMTFSEKGSGSLASDGKYYRRQWTRNGYDLVLVVGRKGGTRKR